MYILPKLPTTAFLHQLSAFANELPPIDDELEVWATTAQSCAYLKYSRTTLWRKLKSDSTFPRPFQFGGKKGVLRWRIAELKAWAEAQPKLPPSIST